MKVVCEMLGHSSIGITADVYTSVLPEVAHAAAEAVARLVPRTPRPDPAGPISAPSDPRNDAGPPSTRKKAQVERVRRQGLEPRTRGLRVRCSAN